MGTIPFKAWKMEQAERFGLSLHAFERLLERGRIPYPPLERVNARVINVPANALAPAPIRGRTGRDARFFCRV